MLFLIFFFRKFLIQKSRQNTWSSATRFQNQSAKVNLVHWLHRQKIFVPLVHPLQCVVLVDRCLMNNLLNWSTFWNLFQQNVQKCVSNSNCQLTYETVCQSVPKRVPVLKYRLVESPSKSQLQCQTVTETSLECSTVYNKQTVEYPIKRCKTEFVDKCLPMMVPSSKIVKDPRTESRTFSVNVCKIDTVMDEYCATLPIGETCRTSQVGYFKIFIKRIIFTKMIAYVFITGDKNPKIQD